MLPFLKSAAPAFSVNFTWPVAPFTQPSDSDAHRIFLKESTDIVSEMLALRGHTKCVYNESPNDRHSSSTMLGIPNFARAAVIGSKIVGSGYVPEIVFEPGQIFRHYIRSYDAASAIIESLELLAGPLAFTFSGGRNSLPYLDLTGVFFTTPDFAPDEVGVPDSLHYIDFTLPEHTPFLHLSGNDNRYLLLPGQAGYYGWFKKGYEQWLEQGRPEPSRCHNEYRNSDYSSGLWRTLMTNAESYEKIYASGGLKTPARLPLQRIIRSGLFERR